METVKQGVDQRLGEGQEKLHRMWLSWNQREQGLQGPEQDPAEPEVPRVAWVLGHGSWCGVSPRTRAGPAQQSLGHGQEPGDTLQCGRT